MNKYLSFFAIVSFILSTAVFAAPTDQVIIAELNNLDLKIYDQLKDKIVKNTDPLIIVWSAKLNFYHHQKLQEYPIIPDEYTDLKTIAHVSLATFALFDPANQFPRNMELVKEYQKKIKETLPIIDALPLNNAQKICQKILLTKTDDFIQQAITKNSVNPTQLQRYATEIMPFVQQNMVDATKSQLVLLNAQMTKIQHQLTAAEKNKLFVILPGQKFPRQENILGQYFSKYLNAPIDSKRLIYAEGLTDTQSVLTLVGTWQIDSLLAELFFHDPDRMKRDLRPFIS